MAPLLTIPHSLHQVYRPSGRMVSVGVDRAPSWNRVSERRRKKGMERGSYRHLGGSQPESEGTGIRHLLLSALLCVTAWPAAV